jgi:hypothetical protein
MLRLFSLLCLLGSPLLGFLRVFAFQDEPTAEPAQAAIQSPLPGQALQGNVPIIGKIAVEGFRSAELSFAYADRSRGTWFLIQEAVQSAADGELARWDTTTLTDGVYHLRLVVTFESGDQAEATVPDLRVRNYTPIETNTPAPTSEPVPETATPEAPTTSLAVTASPTPALTGAAASHTETTPVPLPANPAQLSLPAITLSLGIGALGSLAALGLLGLYLGFRRLLEKKRDRD